MTPRRALSPYVTVGTVARAMGVTGATVRNWILKKQLAAIRTVGGAYRIPREDFESLKIKSQISQN